MSDDNKVEAPNLEHSLMKSDIFSALTNIRGCTLKLHYAMKYLDDARRPDDNSLDFELALLNLKAHHDDCEKAERHFADLIIELLKKRNIT